MQTITTLTDIRTWISNCNPGGILNEATLVPALVEALRTSEHPAWGTDWQEWLDVTAPPIVGALARDSSATVDDLRAECARVQAEFIAASCAGDQATTERIWPTLDALRDLIHALAPRPEAAPTTGITPEMVEGDIRRARVRLALARVVPS